VSSSAAQRVADAPELPRARGLAQLLHALNQPLTGLQCSMEVTLASPRTVERHVQCLREGLELAERMRAIVEAIREVTNMEEEKEQEPETIELKSILRETVGDLAPVAESKGVRMDCSASCSSLVQAQKRRMTRAIFRLLESALSLAEPGSVVRIETGGGAEEGWLRVGWQGEAAQGFSRPELGLLIAQAEWEGDGAEWARTRSEDGETVGIRLPAPQGPQHLPGPA
jgi:signal transduction histidine kinase